MFVTVSLVLIAVCAVPAGGKLGGHPKMVLSANRFGIPWSEYRLIGLAELAAAAGVLAGLFWRPIGVAAALGMVALVVGALAFHRRAADDAREAAPALVGFAVSVVYLAVALAG